MNPNPVLTQFGALTPDELFNALKSREVAVVDVRSHAEFVAGHILRSVHLPLAQLETRSPSLIPNTKVEIVLVGDETLTTRAAELLEKLKYSNIRYLLGGISGWAAIGRPLIPGAHAISKALGEFIEREFSTPKLTAEELARRRSSGEQIIVLDTRPEVEFQYVSIPGSTVLPGAEILYRFDQVVPSENATVVVTCAGRTRGIIGAQALITAGVRNPVFSLENGTAGWRFAGLEPSKGSANPLPTPSAETLEKARDRASALQTKYGLKLIDNDLLKAFQSENTRTTYLFDIRTEDEYTAGHVKGSQHVPSGQLLQTTDLFVGVNNARIVVIDGADGVRGAITAYWLTQLGIGEVFLFNADSADFTESGVIKPTDPLLSNGLYLESQQLKALIDTQPLTIIDFAPTHSGSRSRRVIDGSWYSSRESLPGSVDELPGKGAVLFISDDGREAAFAAQDIAPSQNRDLFVLRGGKKSWEAAGLPVADQVHPNSLDPLGPPNPIHTTAEWKKYFNRYVAWGDTIVDLIRADGTLALGRGA